VELFEKVTAESGKVEEPVVKLWEYNRRAASIIRPVKGGDWSTLAEPKGSVLHAPDEEWKNIFSQHNQHEITSQRQSRGTQCT
jgi:hypothetical protein